MERLGSSVHTITSPSGEREREGREGRREWRRVGEKEEGGREVEREGGGEGGRGRIWRRGGGEKW